MESETVADDANREIFVSRLLLWYLGDFGGFRGIRRLLRAVLKLDARGIRIRFQEYSWEEHLQNWREHGS